MEGRLSGDRTEPPCRSAPGPAREPPLGMRRRKEIEAFTGLPGRGPPNGDAHERSAPVLRPAGGSGGASGQPAGVRVHVVAVLALGTAMITAPAAPLVEQGLFPAVHSPSHVPERVPLP